MTRQFDETRFIAQQMEKISAAGEQLGGFIKLLFGSLKRVIVVVSILSGIGLLVFLWSVGKGIKAPSKK